MVKKHTKPVIIGEDKDAQEMLLLGLREFPCERVVLMSTEKWMKKTQKIAEDLEKHNKLETRIVRMDNTTSLEEVFTIVKRVKEEEKDRQCIINVEGDYMSSCLALSSAFVNGIQAIGVMKDQVIAYPIMKFSYYNALTGKKMKIMETLYENRGWSTVEEIHKKLKMSAPLISYHLNGNLKSQGLKDMGLVETKEHKGRLSIQLSTLGKLLVRGLVPYECPTCV